MDGDGKPLIHTQTITLFKFKAEVHPKPRGSINTTNVKAIVLNNWFMSPQSNQPCTKNMFISDRITISKMFIFKTSY